MRSDIILMYLNAQKNTREIKYGIELMLRFIYDIVVILIY